MSLYNYCRAWDYYNAIGWTGSDGKQTPIIVLKDFCDQDHNPVNNAAYAGNFYGWETFLSSSINDLAQCLDVGAHEFTHSVTGTLMTYNAYMNDYGAINEGMSDIHGNLCEMLAGATEDTTWLLGENGQRIFRSMSEPHLYQQPDYVWDIYYHAEVKDPTDTNDHGGVHGNSSLLNRIAYMLCADGGMSLEDARAYWFAVDCAMVPGSDYSQLSDLLPWVMKETGLDSYLEALEKAIDTTRLGETAPPDPLEEDKALLILNLPDNEVFNNGKWGLQFLSINFDQIAAFVKTFMDDIESGNLDGYPKLVREMLFPAPTPTPGPEKKKQGFLESLLQALAESMEKKADPEATPEPAANNPDLAELSAWLQESAKAFLYIGSGSAGADGHSIRVMSIPGLTFPLLAYASVHPGGAVIDQMKYVCFINGQWFDVSGFLGDTMNQEIQPDLKKTVSSLLESDLFAEFIKMLTSSSNLEDILNGLALDVKGGQVIEIPSEGLEKIDLSTGIMNMTLSGAEEPNNRKSRPKLP